MCTVSVVSRDGGVRIGCSRDERLSRAPARPPSHHRCGRRDAWYPVDPESGGTWVGVNDRGMAIAVLNRAGRGVAAAAGKASRGLIVPHLLACSDLRAAADALHALDWSAYAPCRVLAADRRSAILFTPGTEEPPVACSLLKPLLVTSSSLGDHLVEEPRARLFADMVTDATDRVAAQQRFHDHQWPDRSHLSVRMRRSDAATVSRTWIDLDANDIRLRYEPLC